MPHATPMRHRWPTPFPHLTLFQPVQFSSILDLGLHGLGWQLTRWIPFSRRSRSSTPLCEYHNPNHPSGKAAFRPKSTRSGTRLRPSSGWATWVLTDHGRLTIARKLMPSDQNPEKTRQRAMTQRLLGRFTSAADARHLALHIETLTHLTYQCLGTINSRNIVAAKHVGILTERTNPLAWWRHCRPTQSDQPPSQPTDRECIHGDIGMDSWLGAGENTD